MITNLKLGWGEWADIHWALQHDIHNSIEMMCLGSCLHLTFTLWLWPVAFHKLVNSFQLPTCWVFTYLILLYLLVDMLYPLSLFVYNNCLCF